MNAATRVIHIHSGDSLRTIALRELGDAMRWGEIARLNALRPPYIIASADPVDRERGTAIWGDTLQMPVGFADRAPLEPDVLYGRDVSLLGGDLKAEGGDWSLVEGTDNLNAALQRRVMTPTGDLLPHAKFGCDAHKVLGFKLKPIAALLGAGHVKTALMHDPRVQTVQKIQLNDEDGVIMTPDDDGDVARFTAQILPIHGTDAVDLNLVLPWSIPS